MWFNLPNHNPGNIWKYYRPRLDGKDSGITIDGIPHFRGAFVNNQLSQADIRRLAKEIVICYKGAEITHPRDLFPTQIPNFCRMWDSPERRTSVYNEFYQLTLPGSNVHDELFALHVLTWCKHPDMQRFLDRVKIKKDDRPSQLTANNIQVPFGDLSVFEPVLLSIVEGLDIAEKHVKAQVEVTEIASKVILPELAGLIGYYY
jgi:hypothetical protein